MSWSARWVTWRNAWRQAWAHRVSSWAQVAMMFVNDTIWVLFWVLVFERVDSIRGWDVDDVVVLMAIITTSAGLVIGFANNIRHISHLAATGGLDATLALPVSPLSFLLSSRIEAIAMGDVLFGVTLFASLGSPTPTRVAVFAFSVLCAVSIISGFLIVVGSLGFWTSRTEAGDLGFQAIVLFSIYPVDIFGGVTKFLLYAVIPAGFITAIPARLVSEFDVSAALAVFAVAVFAGTAGWATFTLGLRRYTSGATWTQA